MHTSLEIGTESALHNFLWHPLALLDRCSANIRSTFEELRNSIVAANTSTRNYSIYTENQFFALSKGSIILSSTLPGPVTFRPWSLNCFSQMERL